MVHDITIPAHDATITEARLPGSPPEARRLLLVDDDRLFAESTSRMLDRHGYTVDTAHDATNARELLRGRSYDCIVSDLRMPGNARLEFIEDLAGEQDAPPVVVITGHPCVETAVRSLDLRISSYLVKPVGIDELLARVEQAIREVRTRRAASSVLERELGAEAPGSEPGTGQQPVSPPPVDPGRMASLSPREQEVLHLLLEGYRVNTIARRLLISQHTVRNHLKKIFAKLDVRSQTELLEKLKP